MAHVAGYVAYSTLHTTLIAGMRAVVFPMLGYGPYDYGIMSVRYFMEAAQDLFSYGTYLAVLTLLRVQHHLRAREVRAAELERDAANARLEALSLRLQPHFLFNARNTISSTVYEDAAAADDLIGRLGELLRASLRTSDRQEISLAEELEILGAYRALVEARFGDRARFAIEIDDAARSLAVPAFLLQPLIENAVRHGMTLEFGHVEIVVNAAVNRGVLRLIVENDAPDTGGVATPDGTGLGATRDRLRLLYGTEASLDTTRAGGRFRVIVTIPAHDAAPVDPPLEESTARAHR
jgi:LytS/YehU family sensor histidine kinase